MTSEDLKNISTEELVKLVPNESCTKDMLRAEIAYRMSQETKDEKELQDLWRAFKKLT
jgi:hypothetical protein